MFELYWLKQLALNIIILIVSIVIITFEFHREFLIYSCQIFLDFFSYFSQAFIALFGAVVGAYLTYRMTGKIEKRKKMLESESALRDVYEEIFYLKITCENSIYTLRDSYCKVLGLETLKGNLDSQGKRALSDFSIPNYIVLSFFEPQSLNAYNVLTLDQRRAIRNIVSIASNLEGIIKEISSNKNFLDEVTSNKLRYIMTFYAAIYNNVSRLDSEKERFVFIGEDPRETFKSVLEELDVKIGFSDALDYIQEVLDKID